MMPEQHLDLAPIDGEFAEWMRKTWVKDGEMLDRLVTLLRQHRKECHGEPWCVSPEFQAHMLHVEDRHRSVLTSLLHQAIARLASEDTLHRTSVEDVENRSA
jgi:hypothetical protein